MKKYQAAIIASVVWGCSSDPQTPVIGDRPDAGMDMPADSNTSDMTVTPDMTTEPDQPVDMVSEDMPSDMGPAIRTLANYRTCELDSDCPVGLGTCVLEIPLNRPDADGRDRVPLNEIFPELAQGQGVCSSVCTVNTESCSELSVNGNTPDPQPYVCQVIFEGQSPYPNPAPALPFDGELSPSELTAGVPFGAICRPPFQLSPDVDDGFCAPCVGGEACAGSAVCWDALTGEAAADGVAGTCLGACEGECPSGFECADIAGGSYCKPIVDTCSACLDRDGDGRGTGRCGGAAQPVTPVDCNDLNADVYYDAANPGHAFPEFCAPENDYNCNGLSDADEQIASTQWGDDHCTACGDTCSGDVLNGSLSCVQGVCTAICEMTHASCDGDARNGCEQPVDDSSRIYYRDSDGDGFGDPAVPQFACDPAVPPAGFVDNDDDCDDTSDQARPGGTEVCDGLDNDCDGDFDEGITFNTNGTNDCNAAAQGICANGTAQCDGAAGWTCLAADPEVEMCNGLDDNCDGQVDLTNGVPPVGAPIWYPDCDNDGYGVQPGALSRCFEPQSAPTACPNGSWSTVNTDCNDSDPSINPGRMEDCSTAADDNCLANDPPNTWTNAKSYYFDRDGDGYSPTPNSRTSYCTIIPNNWSEALYNQTDCDDNNASVNPSATETCNTPYDDDCDGQVHDAATGKVRRYRDVDGDGYGPNSSGFDFCFSSMTTNEQNTYPTSNGGDCNDSTTQRQVASNGHLYTGVDQAPNKIEVCEGLDNNCDGVIDDGCPVDFNVRNARSANDAQGTGSGWQLFECPGNKVMSGIRVRGKIPAGFCGGETGVFGVHAICTDPNISVNTNNNPFTYTTVNSSSEEGSILGFAPGPDGGCGWNTITDNTLNCSGNSSMRGFIGRDGARIDRIGPVCVQRTLTTSVTPATLNLSSESNGSQAPSGWNGGGDFRTTCANNEVVKGFWGAFQNNRLTAVDLRCVDMSLINR